MFFTIKENYSDKDLRTLASVVEEKLQDEKQITLNLQYSDQGITNEYTIERLNLSHVVTENRTQSWDQFDFLPDALLAIINQTIS